MQTCHSLKAFLSENTTPLQPEQANMSKVALITGASSGVGKEAAKILASRGWHVIAQGRDPARTARAEAEIRSVATARVDMLNCDLAELSQTARMVDEITALTGRIDVLLANAGGMRSKMVITPEGNEASFAGNHLGHFLLTERLMPQLQAAGNARVISTTSDGHYYCKAINWDDMQLLNNWDPGAAYCLVKLYNILFTRELAKRGAKAGIIAHAFHPGTVSSNFVSHVPESTRAYMATLIAQPPEIAAEPLVWLASAAEAGLTTGQYWNMTKSEPPSPIARDDNNAARLWTESMALISKAGV
jgi:NAD(P)-dependent dehydrogenase (short-subunit alcohol dehydrogenase family)